MWTRISDIDRMFGNMGLLRSRMNRLFTDFDKYYGNDFGWEISSANPKTNLYEDENHFEIKTEVPGMSKDDINLKIQGNYFEISGEKKYNAPEGYKANRVEREAISFTRSFTLPSEVHAEKVEATIKNGILTLSLPKAEAAKPKQIAIS